ncbi:SRPBCC family protein [Niveibacterium sp. SC-1]|uniref:SRPBCC family protein n=1 Tax=Niveibacterium sp. SC-1 TaxID=3135646 RepID=UPI00311D3DE1
MAYIRRQITIDRPAADVWDALRDIGALHTRLVVGFVTDCRLEGESRLVTFANGTTVREQIIDVGDEDRRVAWSAAGGLLSYYHASAQVRPVSDASCEVVWVADLLPHEAKPTIATMIEAGLAAMKRTLESARAA